MRAELKKKNFRNEAEEAKWWDEHQDALAGEFEKAAAAGTLGRGTAARKAGATPTTTIRLDPADVAKARTQAERRGLRYQTYLKMLIHQALHHAETRRLGPRRYSSSPRSPTTNNEAPMYYFFLDESYPRSESHKRIVMTAWAVEQTKFDACKERLRDLHRPPVLKRIDELFEATGALAIVGKANLEDHTFRAGERDGTDDIADMARTDNIWSQSAFFAVGFLTKELARRGNNVGTIDIYHDPKSLKTDHAEALRRALEDTLVETARQRSLPHLHSLEIGRIEEVRKAKNRVPNRFQLAIWIADKLCSGFTGATPSNTMSRVIQWDMSDLIKRTTQQFDGIPFRVG
jgi:predicted DNA binding CopG/RHH family protein